MVFQKIINGMINIKESLIKNKSLVLYIFLIILFQLLMHFFVYSNIFGNIGFFCGDSPQYFNIANNINTSGEDKPSGFPLFLHLLFYISENPLFLTILSVVISIITSIFFFLTFRLFFKKKNLIPFIITILFFINPTIAHIDSMIYMSDSFSFFLFSIGTYLLLANQKESKINYQYLIAGLIFSYLTIVKSAFIYILPFVIFYIFYKIYQRNKRISIKILIGFMIILTSIPLLYTVLFNKPRTGIATLENFGGVSIFGNILPYISCNQLTSIATTAREINSINQNCDDVEINHLTPKQQIWDGNSTMHKIGRGIIPNYNKIDKNQLFQKLATAILFKYPTVMFYTIKNIIINGYLGEVVSDQISIGKPVHIEGWCGQFISNILNIDKESYTRGSHLNLENNKFVKIISFMQLNIGKITNWIIAILFLILIPFYAIYKKIISSEFIFLYIISAVYIFIISLGSYFDSRYYIIFNYLVLLSACSLIAIKKTGNKKRDSSDDNDLG